MPLQRSVYRIEELTGLRERPTIPTEGHPAGTLQHAEIINELRALRALLEAHRPAPAPTQTAAHGGTDADIGAVYGAVKRTKQEIATLMVNGFAKPEVGRVTHELNAAVVGSESATHRILEAGEEIEQHVKGLSAALDAQERDRACDILDQVTRIFEACHFQDLAGQRINKVSNTLCFIEDHILRLIAIWGGVEAFAEFVPVAQAERDADAKLVNGPRLEGEHGHISQEEIDAMFARRG